MTPRRGNAAEQSGPTLQAMHHLQASMMSDEDANSPIQPLWTRYHEFNGPDLEPGAWIRRLCLKMEKQSTEALFQHFVGLPKRSDLTVRGRDNMRSKLIRCTVRIH